jgi:hypothetical protein
LPARLRLSDPERSTLAEIGKRLGRKALSQVACVAKPDTILAWYRKFIAQKFDGSKHRSYPGRPPIEPKLEALIVQMARENSGWGYDRIVGALANLGYTVSDQTVGNVMKRHGIAPAPKRSQNTTWKEFIQSHLAVLAGIDFFTVEVLTWRGLVTYYVLFFIHLESRRISLARITRYPDQAWMQQMARNATGEAWGFLDQRRGLLMYYSYVARIFFLYGVRPSSLGRRKFLLNLLYPLVNSLSPRSVGNYAIHGKSCSLNGRDPALLVATRARIGEILRGALVAAPLVNSTRRPRYLGVTGVEIEFLCTTENECYRQPLGRKRRNSGWFSGHHSSG